MPLRKLGHDLLKENLQSKKHHKTFPEQVIVSMECRFLAILRNEHNLVKALL
jgi:hypothetical protein